MLIEVLAVAATWQCGLKNVEREKLERSGAPGFGRPASDDAQAPVARENWLVGLTPVAYAARVSQDGNMMSGERERHALSFYNVRQWLLRSGLARC